MNPLLVFFCFLITLTCGCSLVEEIPQDVLDMRAREEVALISDEELEYRYFTNASPSTLFKRSRELRYADLIIADELAARGMDAEGIQHLKQIANAPTLINHLQEKYNSYQGTSKAQFIINETKLKWKKTEEVYQCWANNLWGYQPQNYTKYEFVSRWRFSRYGKYYDTYHIMKLFVKNSYSKSRYIGLQTEYRLIGSCGGHADRPPDCRSNPNIRRTPTYCDPA